ncbi:hypothetical protein MLD38_030010 [Melastoma candidum]|uniref:Uncharacterized protein n=1 Tax=Melastoma candidum TaxID=119954 RepID=A0ACB9MLW8_9MYRT|nr:hypothetical protein MLD38_030010 [Melastoma candidum]
MILGFRNTAVTAFPNTDVRNSAHGYSKKIVDIHHIKSTARAPSFKDIKEVQHLGCSHRISLRRHLGRHWDTQLDGKVCQNEADDDGNFEGQYLVFISGAASIVAGSLLWTGAGIPEVIL